MAIAASKKIVRSKHKATSEPKYDVAKMQQPALIDTTRKSLINGRLTLHNCNEFSGVVGCAGAEAHQRLNNL